MDEDFRSKRHRIDAQLDLIVKFIEQENTAFISIGSLGVALIVILSLNKELISFAQWESKTLLTIFLALIIFSLGIHLYFLSEGKKRSVEIIDEIVGKKVMDSLSMSLSGKILAYVPRIVTGIFFLAVCYIIYVVWR